MVAIRAALGAAFLCEAKYIYFNLEKVETNIRFRSLPDSKWDRHSQTHFLRRLYQRGNPQNAILSSN
jgi:hypothetical protein